MLLFMSYNGYVIFAACLGLSLGYLFSGDMEKVWKKDVGNETFKVQDIDCCMHE